MAGPMHRPPRGMKPQVKNPGKLFMRLMKYVFRTYKWHYLTVIFLIFADIVIEKSHLLTTILHRHLPCQKSSVWMMMAVTLHNIPEGMAVGITFAGALLGNEQITLAGAFALAIGIAIQNFPEGAIISMPLRSEGATRKKAFFYGMLSGLVEPIGGFLTILLASLVVPVLPYLLSFAAGAMIYVVVEELIPESQSNEKKELMALFTIIGFLFL